MQICIVLALFFMLATPIVADVYRTLCRRTGGSLHCYDSSTWGYDERTRKCYNVKKGSEPCGFFDGEKGCIDFCVKGRKG
ncbi:uncharacterized protein LOC108604184 [Drosophila busckii]|uniref:uncharacterized protein LOC108604184 n=1 Tax=Drosophila busckii TaxID=30019 RepID=UPI00083F06C0|nr:uncharacterized protein LOC108604184 [Drosophila busckii]